MSACKIFSILGGCHVMLVNGCYVHVSEPFFLFCAWNKQGKAKTCLPPTFSTSPLNEKVLLAWEQVINKKCTFCVILVMDRNTTAISLLFYYFQTVWCVLFQDSIIVFLEHRSSTWKCALSRSDLHLRFIKRESVSHRKFTEGVPTSYVIPLQIASL